MKLTLITPQWLFLNKQNYLPQNLGVRYIASYLIEKGHNVKIIDSLQEGFNSVKRISIKGETYNRIGLYNDQLLQKIPEDTDYIGLSIPFTYLKSIAKDLAVKIRDKFKVPIISGGTLPSINPASVLGYSDYSVVGEGEIALGKLLSGIKTEKIEGFHNETFSNGQAIFHDNLNALPFPYREDFQNYYRMSSRGRKLKRTASIITSRGCPFSCNFCSTHLTSGKKWRYRSVENVIEEIKYLNERFKIDHIEIEDDNFTLNLNRAKKILNEIIKLNKNNITKLSFSTPNGLRIDTLDIESISLFKKANFLMINLALESGDEEILVKMNKQMSLSKVVELSIAASKVNLPILFFFMIGYPGESNLHFLNSIKFAEKLKHIGKGNFAFTTFIARAYPGTNLYKECLSKGYIESNIEDEVFLGAKYNIITPDFDEKELQKRLKYVNNSLNDGKKQDYFL